MLADTVAGSIQSATGDCQPMTRSQVDRSLDTICGWLLPPRCVLCGRPGQRPCLDLCASCEASLPADPQVLIDGPHAGGAVPGGVRLRISGGSPGPAAQVPRPTGDWPGPGRAACSIGPCAGTASRHRLPGAGPAAPWSPCGSRLQPVGRDRQACRTRAWNADQRGYRAAFARHAPAGRAPARRASRQHRRRICRVHVRSRPTGRRRGRRPDHWSDRRRRGRGAATGRRDFGRRLVRRTGPAQGQVRLEAPTLRQIRA